MVYDEEARGTHEIIPTVEWGTLILNKCLYEDSQTSNSKKSSIQLVYML